MDYKNLATSILEKVGGKENVQNVVHCATRLRFTLKDDHIADREGIEGLRGVSGLVTSNGQFQVIIGPDVASVYGELSNIGIGSSNEKKNKGNIINNLLDFIAGCFTPMVGVIAAGGMLQVLLSLLSMSGLLPETSDSYLVLYQISQAAFYFIPIYLGYSIASRFKIDPFLGMLLGGILVMPGLVSLLTQENGITLFGIGVPNVGYSASVVPILLGVWFMSFIYKFADRYVPNSVKFILRPLLTILIAAPIVLLFLGPLGVTIGNYVATFLNYLTNNFGPLAVMFMGAFAQLLVMTGMHTCLTPILLATLATYGYDNLIVPGMLLGIAGEAAVCIAAAIKTKDSEFKQLSISCAITSIMGISEPALYGVTLRLKKPLIGIIVGGALGGLYYGLMSVNTPVIIASFVAIPSYSNIIHTIIGLAICMVTTFLFTWFMVKDSDFPNAIEEKKTSEINVTGKINEVKAVAKGNLLKLSDVNDSAFASNALGKGIAIMPENGDVFAPFDGRVTAIFPSKHAIGVTNHNGVEVLIHVGINTVNLNGEGFTSLIEMNDMIACGQKILQFDLNGILDKGYDTTIMVTVTNTNDMLDVVPCVGVKADKDTTILTVLV